MGISAGIVLAAGKGSRLGTLTAEAPKCLLSVAEKPILEYILDAFEHCGLKRALVVVGYQAERVWQAIGVRPGLHVEYVVNDRYHETNTMYSLLLAQAQVQEGCALVEGDCCFDPALLSRVLARAGDERIIWAGRPFTEGEDGCVLSADEQGRIRELQIVKHGWSPPPWGAYKSASVLAIGRQLAASLTGWLERGVQEGKTNLYYDLILAGHLKEAEFQICDISDLPWAEVDTEADLAAAQRLFGGRGPLKSAARGKAFGSAPLPACSSAPRSSSKKRPALGKRKAPDHIGEGKP
jgi:choline kinase